MSFEKYLADFVAENKKPALQVWVTATGGGVSLARLMSIPGSSAIVAGMEFPYDKAAVATLLDFECGDVAAKQYFEKAVQPEVARNLSRIAERKSPGGIGVGITAALTSNRYRRGDNQAFIVIADGHYHMRDIFHLTFPKLAEEDHKLPSKVLAKRIDEDETIAKLVLEILYNYNTESTYNNLRLSGQLKWTTAYDD